MNFSLDAKCIKQLNKSMGQILVLIIPYLFLLHIKNCLGCINKIHHRPQTKHQEEENRIHPQGWSWCIRVPWIKEDAREHIQCRHHFHDQVKVKGQLQDYSGRCHTNCSIWR